MGCQGVQAVVETLGLDRDYPEIKSDEIILLTTNKAQAAKIDKHQLCEISASTGSMCNLIFIG